MKKKKLLLIATICLFVVVLFCLTGCTTTKKNIDGYSADDLNAVGKLIKLMHSWIGNYGWTVVVFTVFLKLAMVPFDFWQRSSMRKSTLKMQKIQPQIEKIDKQFGENTQRANEEKQKLYQKYGVSMVSSCLPTIITMVIFFVMFGGLTDYSNYCSAKSYIELDNAYYTAQYQTICNISDEDEYVYNADATRKDMVSVVDKYLNGAEQTNVANIVSAGETAVSEYYKANHESWLWMQNVWQPDTWTEIMSDYSSFSSTFDLTSYYSAPENVYNKIRECVLSTGERGENGKWNGLMILPIMSIGLSFLSIFISQTIEKKNRNGQEAPQTEQQAASNKSMLIMMPLMMAFFGFRYTGAFAIYMVVNYTLSIISTVVLRAPVEKHVLKAITAEEEKMNGGKASYMR